MADPDLVVEIEASGYRAWPARELVEYDGWQLRYADGFSRRANSLLPIGVSSLDVDTKLDHCSRWFDRRGLGLVVRCTPLCEPGIDDELAQRGFTREGETRVMVADLAGGDDHGPKPAERATAGWWDAMARLWSIAPQLRPAWRGIVGRITLPAAYAAIPGADDAIAAGLGVVDGASVGLFEIVVDPARRRRGHGRELTLTLLGWGRSRGAERAYLQVVSGNEPAISLYESLGFRHAYTYWYRRAASADAGE